MSWAELNWVWKRCNKCSFSLKTQLTKLNRNHLKMGNKNGNNNKKLTRLSNIQCYNWCVFFSCRVTTKTISCFAFFFSQSILCVSQTQCQLQIRIQLTESQFTVNKLWEWLFARWSRNRNRYCLKEWQTKKIIKQPSHTSAIKCSIENVVDYKSCCERERQIDRWTFSLSVLTAADVMKKKIRLFVSINTMGSSNRG